MTNPITDERINAVLDRLYQLEADQQPEIGTYFQERTREPDFDPRAFDHRFHEFFADKLIALERIKAEFCYQVCRSIRAKKIVEAGTSFGVSTIFLAAAVRENIKDDGGDGRVHCSEYEPEKAKIARGNFEEAGVSELIDLREGDILEQLADVDDTIDFMLMDIWGPIPRPLLEMFSDRLRPGAVVIADNTDTFRDNYKDYFDFITDPSNRLSTITLPFEGGLEFTVKQS